MFHKPHFKGDDFPSPQALTIAGIRDVEVFIPNANAKEHRWVVDVKEDSRYIFLSETLFDNIATATGSDETNDWVNKQVQFYREQVKVRGQARWGVRARSVGNATTAQPLAKPPVKKAKFPSPITDTTPTRPYPPEILLKGFAAQLKLKPEPWKAAAIPPGVQTQVAIGFKAMFPTFSAGELSDARHAVCKYLCDGRYRLSSDEAGALSWADAKVLTQWLYGKEKGADGYPLPCPLAAKEAVTILSFVGFFDEVRAEEEAGAEVF
jgi:hypothetical protein